jgi:hypothetical protein
VVSRDSAVSPPSSRKSLLPHDDTSAAGRQHRHHDDDIRAVRGDRGTGAWQGNLVTAERALMAGTWAAGQVGWVLLASAALTAVFGPLTMRLYRAGQGGS